MVNFPRDSTSNRLIDTTFIVTDSVLTIYHQSILSSIDYTFIDGYSSIHQPKHLSVWISMFAIHVEDLYPLVLTSSLPEMADTLSLCFLYLSM